MDKMQFTQVIPRLRVLETRLLDKTKLDRMIDSNSAEDALKVLQETEYANVMSNIKRPEDYEEILSEQCDLAIESTMIYHNPEVKEKLEELGMKVFVERSSYEKHPLGRLEWIKLFGVLFGKEQQAKAYFDAQVERVKPILEKENTGKTVAFFAVSSDGTITVRKTNDYVASMIGLAGGNYSLGGYTDGEKNALSTMKMQMEDFYAAEKDADILIYNGTIEGELKTVDELIKKNSLFEDFKAVKNGQVYTTGSNFYQQSTGTCDFIEDLNKILTGDADTSYRFLKKIE